jgi:DNA repair ATPase RecN
MDEDKIDKTIEIILQNQAQFYADLQMIQETQKHSEKSIDNLEKVASLVLESIKQTNENVNNLSIKVDKLTDSQKETDERLRETDKRLNAVIYMAEKFFGNQNGKSE